MCCLISRRPYFRLDGHSRDAIITRAFHESVTDGWLAAGSRGRESSFPGPAGAMVTVRMEADAVVEFGAGRLRVMATPYLETGTGGSSTAAAIC